MSNELTPLEAPSPMAGTSKSRHNHPKQPVLRTPEPVQKRVLTRHIGGESNRAIAREEGIDRSTVGRILSQPEVAELITESKARLLSLVPKAVAAYEEVLNSDNLPLKAATATKLLEAVGVLQKGGAERLADQQTALEKEQRQQRLLVLGQMTDMVLVKRERYGTPLPPGFDDLRDALHPSISGHR
jgi:DNA-binding MarR family transcriptional regulator